MKDARRKVQNRNNKMIMKMMKNLNIRNRKYKRKEKKR